MTKRPITYLLIFFSGFASLIYEIVWTRQLTLVFGVSIYAVSAVIAVFLLGLAVGSYFIGRFVDRQANPLLIFAVLELVVGGFALFFPYLTKLIAPLYSAVFDFSLSRSAIFLIRFTFTFGLLIIPSILMGGTLPVAGKLFSGSLVRFGSAVAKLYGLNTLGGMLGATFAGFFLLQRIGVSGTTYVAFACNVIVGTTALWMSRSFHKKWLAEPKNHSTKSIKGKNTFKKGDIVIRRKVLFVILISGFCALAYEVLWTKMLILILGNSSWAFSTVLVTFLASIAVGSLFLAPWLARKFNRLQALSMLQILIAIAAFFSLMAFRWMATAKLGNQAEELWQVVLRHFFRAGIIMAPAMLMSGAVLPLATLLCTKSEKKAGSDFGLTLAFNTAGSVLGSIAAGYILISAFGIQNSIILIAIFNGLAAVWLLQSGTQGSMKYSTVHRVVAMLLVLALVSSLYLYKPPLTPPLPGHELRYYKEHTAGIVSIYHDQPSGTKIFNLNNINEVTTHKSSMITFRLMAYLPYFLHKNPHDVLVITFGAGIVAGSLGQLNLNRLDCVEINPNAKEVGRHFALENHNIIENKKLNLIIEDGRNFLTTTDRKYDIITADATHPTGADSWILFTKEYYELCRRHLNEEGLFVQWLPLHALSENAYFTILATAAGVFDDLSIWFSGMDAPIAHTLMIASVKPLALNFQQIQDKMLQPGIRNDMEEVGLNSAESLLAHFITNKNNLQAMLENRPLNTDNLAVTAFPDELPLPDRWAKNLRLLTGIRALPTITHAPADALKKFERLNRLSDWLLKSVLDISAGDLKGASAWLSQVKSADLKVDELSAAYTSSAENFIDLAHLKIRENPDHSR